MEDEAVKKHLCILVTAVVFFSASTFATNGLNLIGFGHESTMMGGADIAVARDSSALNSNPAGIALQDGRLLDIEFALVNTGGTEHEDTLNSAIPPANSPFYGAGFGFLDRTENSRLNWGFGLFGQGGVGIEYDALNTAFGTIDRVENTLLNAKLSTGLSYEVSDRLSLGLSLAMLYSDFDLSFFPDTSSFNPLAPQAAFFGIRSNNMTADGLSTKFGIRYMPDVRTTLAAVYTTQTVLDYAGNSLVADMTSTGLGKVKYRDVEITGRRQPQEIGFGIAHQAMDRLLLSVEVSWIDWSSAIDTATLTARRPDNALATPVLELGFVDEWNDQYVFAAGMAYNVSDRLVIRGGYNYGRNPIPSGNLTPLTPAVGERHLTAGAGYRAGEWEFSGGVQLDLRNSVTYTNPRLPFGADASESVEAWTLILAGTRRW